MGIAEEMAEQPAAAARLLEEGHRDATRIGAAVSGKFDSVVVAARGSSDHAAVYAQYLLGIALRVPVGLATPSVITRHGVQLQFRRTLVVGISQSGASPDVAAVLGTARAASCPTVAITVFRIASSMLTLVGLLGSIAVAIGIATVQGLAPWLVVLVAGVEAPGIAIGLSARRVDAERLGATSGDLLTGLALVAAGLTPVVAGIAMVTPSDQLTLVVTWLIGLVVASRLAVGPLARLADRSSAERDLVVSVAEAERRRLAAQLHDGPLQDLLLLLRRLELDGDDAAAARVRGIADELREVSGELRVPVLDDLGAGAALEWLVARLERITGDEIVLERSDPERPPTAVELAVFRVAQEALANAARHGRPPVHVRYAAAADHVRLDVGDAGPGLDPDAVTAAGAGGRFGLLAMRQRAEQIGARLTVTAPEGAAPWSTSSGRRKASREQHDRRPADHPRRGRGRPSGHARGDGGAPGARAGSRRRGYGRIGARGASSPGRRSATRRPATRRSPRSGGRAGCPRRARGLTGGRRAPDGL